MPDQLREIYRVRIEIEAIGVNGDGDYEYAYEEEVGMYIGPEFDTREDAHEYFATITKEHYREDLGG